MTQRRRGPLRRARRPQTPRRVLRIHAEGAVTEIGYIEELSRRHRGNVRIDFGRSGRVPATLVDNACRDMDENRRARPRGDPPYDEVWCVFDVDEHPNINQVISRARQKAVETAVSNPCFELWLVPHYQNQTGPIERRKVQRLAKDLGLIEGKVIRAEVFDDLVDAYEDAKTYAKELDRMHERNVSPPGHNPSTSMWRLVDAIRQGSRGRT